MSGDVEHPLADRMCGIGNTGPGGHQQVGCRLGPLSGPQSVSPNMEGFNSGKLGGGTVKQDIARLSQSARYGHQKTVVTAAATWFCVRAAHPCMVWSYEEGRRCGKVSGRRRASSSCPSSSRRRPALGAVVVGENERESMIAVCADEAANKCSVQVRVRCQYQYR